MFTNTDGSDAVSNHDIQPEYFKLYSKRDNTSEVLVI